MVDWHRKVYHPRMGKRFETKRWLRLRQRVIERDEYQCQMCKQYYGDSIILQAHHIKPRKRGGKDHMRNLVTLCSQCHDLAETEELSRKEIVDYKAEKYVQKLIKEKQNSPGLDWHKWVYGGYRRPQ